MAASSSSPFSPLLLLCAALLVGQAIASSNIGINYGRIADNLPPPTQVVALLRSLGITKVKLYDADPDVLRAFANSNIDLTVQIGNGYVTDMADPTKAESWIQLNVQPYLPQTRITGINVGNEVFAADDSALKSALLPAMQSVHKALIALGLDQQVKVSTAHAFTVMGNSYPPSAGSFSQDVAHLMQPLLDFHSQTHAPFYVNAYPFFAYEAKPDPASLPYFVFQPNSGITDPGTNLWYDSMLYAQIDSVYAAMKALGHADIDVMVSETGWPSKGDANEAGATPENAALYNGNLMRRIEMQQGTPMRQSLPVTAYVFTLFNEDSKPGPTSERNYGLFYPNATPVYDVGLAALTASSSFKPMAMPGGLMFGSLMFAVASTLWF